MTAPFYKNCLSKGVHKSAIMGGTRRQKRRKRMTDVPAQRREANLADLAEEINSEHRAFVGSLRKTAEHGIRAGELLAEAKKQCQHGTWLEWLEANFEGSARAAQEYMRFYNRRDEIQAKTHDGAHFGISAARELLAAPREDGDPFHEVYGYIK